MASQCNGGVFKIPEIKFTQLFINGQFVDSLSGRTFETRDPRTGDVISNIAEGDKEDIDSAVKAAREAFDHGKWPRMSGFERGRIMMKFADLVEQHTEEAAILDSLDAGKLLTLGRALDVPSAVNMLRYYAGAADKIHGETLELMPSAPMSMSMSMSIGGSSSSMAAGHRRPPSPFADLHHRRRRTRTSSVPTHPHSNSFLFPISSSQLQFTFASLYSSSSSSCYASESRSRSKSEASLCNTCCCCFNPTNAHHQLSNSYSSSISISSITASSDTSPSNSQGFGNVRRGVRFLVVACACVLFVTRCQRVIALEQGVSGTCGQFFIIKGRVFGPKLMQVLVVLKEQGLILAALLSLSAFFSMAETSITTLWPWKVRELAEKEPENGVFRMLHSDVTRFLTTILIGTTVVNIAATALVTEAATTIFGEAGVTAATGVMTVAVLLLTEITPKSIAVHNATDVARFVARPVAWLSLFLYPVGRVVTFLSMGMLKMLGLEGRSEPYVTEDELKLMLRGAELSGAIEEEEQDMIENVLEIKDTHVREVMTPLVDVVAIDGSATLIDFQKSWETHQYSRVPVFEERIDNIMGIAYAMDLLEYVGRAEKLKESTVRDIAHPTYFVPDSMSVWNLLREFRIRKVHMAVVLNEYGGTVGIVTLEDVVEEIVGEIFDENDSKEEIQKKTGYIVMQEDGTFDVDANTSIDQLSEELGVKIPEGHQYETVSGFICESFGYIPEEGAQMIVLLERATQVDNNEYTGIESDNRDEKEKHQTFELEVLEANERKVGKVRFKPINHVSSDLETKGLNRLLSTKVVKMKMNRETEPDSNNTRKISEMLEEDNYSNKVSCKERVEDSSIYAPIEKGGGVHDSNNQQ